MPAAQDILHDSDGDLLIQNGDFVIGFSDAQHIEDIIDSFKGWWKEFPNLGVGIDQYLNSDGAEQEIQRQIKIELQNDGFDVQNPEVFFDAAGKLQIAPNAIRI